MKTSHAFLEAQRYDLPVLGKRFCVQGFNEAQNQEVREELEAMGLEIVTLRKRADVLVVPDGTVFPGNDDQRQEHIELSHLRRMLNPAAFAAPIQEHEMHAAIECSKTAVRIIDVSLKRHAHAGPRVPVAERFARVCLDRAFLEAARAVAKAVEFGNPCVLEGETAAAKSTVIQWVAHLLNQEVVRMNLNGQTDTGELIGRYVPDDRPDSRSGWRFQEGLIPQAMRHGWWVILDEMNLAEPQVLERLNPVLEEPASLLLTEGAGTSFGLGGEVPIHPSFHMFATLNPAEYAGRSTLSAAFRDRWTSWNWVPLPDEVSLRQTLEFWCYGSQPPVLLGENLWKGKDTYPVLPALGAAIEQHELLARVVRFHAAIANASQGKGSLGRSRREAFVFTRRTLWTALVQCNARLQQRGGALREHLQDCIVGVYGQRLREAGEREALLQALRASGIL